MVTLGNLLNAQREISFGPSAVDTNPVFAKDRSRFGMEREEFAGICLRSYLNHRFQNPFSCASAT
ncbi:Hypothetical protein DEACI_0980 [Acididesulfobacillus acetoxydans]|uniref:Uncharacterized protein n=1 Tax=Acididesulfobacillus acetoxydans TaxID=1561005 RepID=A0A8S0XVH1_9FIRM|nr:Hypothetical protein DEACI_0980 [Acididesulfobacillus acetoxydans]CEJ06103.1 Hypothetical protein DEACI_0549 [Acididesulfobacillus acetoxydans]